VGPGTHVITYSKTDNGTVEHEENTNIRFGGLSNKFVWQEHRFISHLAETYCDECDPQFNNAELDVMSALENIS
jgi:hypothetical protein